MQITFKFEAGSNTLGAFVLGSPGDDHHIISCFINSENFRRRSVFMQAQRPLIMHVMSQVKTWARAKVQIENYFLARIIIKLLQITSVNSRKIPTRVESRKLSSKGPLVAATMAVRASHAVAIGE